MMSGDQQIVPSRHLWVGNLAMETPESAVRQKFDPFGELEKVAVYSKFAFVDFCRQQDAENAKQALHGTCIANSPIRIEFNRKLGNGSSRAVYNGNHARPSRSHMQQDDHPSSGSTKVIDRRLVEQPTVVLFVSFPGLKKPDDETLRESFACFGEVVRVKSFEERRYGFVEFRSVREATLAKNSLSEIAGHRVRIEYSKSVEDGHNDRRGVDRKRRIEENGERDVSSKRTRPSPLQQRQSPSPSPEGWGDNIIAMAGDVQFHVHSFKNEGKANLSQPILNCTAKTRLDKLVSELQYWGDSSLLRFEPARSRDVIAYSDLVNDLGTTQQATVAELHDGSMVFLVPPSPFLQHLFKFPLPSDKLSGVHVVKRPQQPGYQPGYTPPQPGYTPPQPGYTLPPLGYAQPLQMMQHPFQTVRPPVVTTDPRAAWSPPSFIQLQQQDQQPALDFVGGPPFATSEAGIRPPAGQPPNAAQIAGLLELLRNMQQQQQQQQTAFPHRQQVPQVSSWSTQPPVDSRYNYHSASNGNTTPPASLE